MKIGIYQNIFRRCGSFEEQIKRAAAHGFDAMDFSDMESYGVKLFSLSAPEFERTLTEYGRIASEHGVEISQTHAPGPPTASETTPAQMAQRLELTTRAIEGAAMMGCPRLVVHPVYPYTSRDFDCPEKTREVNLDFFSKLCGIARKCGVTVCLENTPSIRFSIAKVKEVVDFVKELGDPQLKICLDTGHCTFFQYSPSNAVRLVGGELLEALHVHDNKGSADEHLLPFDGMTDWESFAIALRDVGYKGVLSMELQSYPNLPEPLFDDFLDHLRRRISYIAAIADAKKGE